MNEVVRTVRSSVRAALQGAFVALVLVSMSPASQARTYSSYALVNEDATLRVSGRRIHLYGIYVPPTNRLCRGDIRPVRCAPRAALALKFKIQGFVRCEEKARHRDRSITALCYAKGEDLSAYLIERGWAVALPGAPFPYTVLERIARKNNKGVWAFPVDAISGD